MADTDLIAQFVFTMSRASTRTVVLSYETQDGTAIENVDYVPVSGELIYLPGETSKTVNVQVLQPPTEERKFFEVIITDAVNAVIDDSNPGQAVITPNNLFRGPRGFRGFRGARGLSSYEEAVNNGSFTGTYPEWLDFIKGEYDGVTVASVLDEARSLPDFASLRSYTGRAIAITIRKLGASGLVIRDDSVSGDDNLTKFTDGLGRAWRRVQTSLTLEQCGISSDSTPVQNAAQLKAAILAGVKMVGARNAYSFDFAGELITFAGSVLQMDLGPYLHTFTNWGGIVANNLAVLEYNGRIDAGNGYCKGLGRFRNLLRAKVGIMEFQNVFCINPTADKQFFALEYSSNNYGDNTFLMDIDSVFIKNVRTQTYAWSTGQAMPSTVLGNFGSSSSQEKQHQVTISNCHIEEYYSVLQDGITPTDGDSDVFRLFTNPTQLHIDNLYVKNIAKRLVKTQEAVQFSCPNVVWENDARFTSGVFIGLFEAQEANSGVPTHFEIGVCKATCADGSDRPLLFNASGLDHSITIDNLIDKNIGLYSADRNVGITINKATGRGLSIQATASTRTRLKNIQDSAIRAIRVAQGSIEDFELTLDPTIAENTNFFIGTLNARRGKFLNWRVTNRVLQFSDMDDVEIAYSLGTTGYIRACQPASGKVCKATGVKVNDATLVAAHIFEPASASSGTLIIRDFRGTGGVNLATGLASTGTWNVFLDNCAPSTFTGAGATVKTASYV